MSDTKKGKRFGYFRVLRTMAGIAFHKMPLLTCMNILIVLVSEAATAAAVLFKQNLFDKAEVLTAGGAVQPVFLAGLALGLFLIVQMLLQSADELVLQKCILRLQQEAGSVMNRKAGRVDPICYEDSRFLDDIERAERGMEGAADVFLETIGYLGVFVGYFGLMGAYLANLEPGLLIMLFVSFVPYLIAGAVRYSQHKQAAWQSAPYRRKGDYYGRCITDREYAKETRLLGAYGYFFRKFEENIRMVRELDWKATKKSEAVEIFLRFISMTGYIGMIVMLFYDLLHAKVGIGAFAAIASSLDYMSDQLDVMFRSRLTAIVEDAGSAENFIAFLELPERKGETENPKGKSAAFPLGKTVEFQDVCFAYPDAGQNSLEHVNLTIHENETIAIVGSNGAGKSTFARLLLGIYRPTSGHVKIDGVDTARINPRDSAGSLSAVFQRFQKYKMTLRDNVILSESGRPVDEVRAEGSLDKADLDRKGESFPDGMDTMLAREFGGTDLSGGQWQRLAIARGLYRRHNLIVLDEPTAAIDPLEETAVYKKFAELSKDKTAVIITHRLGSAKIADRIVVLEKGRIAEIGNHEELMEKKGLYYEMFTAQAKWYA